MAIPNISVNHRQDVLNLYQDLRVADVRDGMDWNMLHCQGSMSPDIRPLYRTRAYGIARTVRYIPFHGEIPQLTPDEYTEWSRWYYATVCPYTWVEDIQPGDFVVIDQSCVNASLMGSNNTLAGVRNGAAGYVTNGGVRDTDEIILQHIPFWTQSISQSMVQGRLQFEAQDIPVNVGGVLVNPGDVVVADGDGVIVVPRSQAFEVAKYAHRELEKDKTSRRNLYREMGMPLDDTVR
jgi:4-hydroxy-4-methyl-2-oxoglutarate aldolase